MRCKDMNRLVSTSITYDTASGNTVVTVPYVKQNRSDCHFRRKQQQSSFAGNQRKRYSSERRMHTHTLSRHLR